MKKVLSFLLVLSLVLGTFAPAFADDAKYAAQAEILKNLEVLKGDDTGLNLDKELTRQEMMLMMARLMGEEDIATNFPFPTTFTDAQDAPWKWSNIIAWAEAKQITNGMGDGTFGYGQNVTLRQLETYLLRALGYEAAQAWENAADLAAEKGLLAGVEEQETVTKGFMAALTLNALKAEKVDSDETLAADLGIELPNPAVSVETVEATVEAGQEVELPETVAVTYENGDVEDVAVVWEEFVAEEAGDFTIEGTLEGDFDFAAEAVITVTETKLAVEEIAGVGAKKIEVKFTQPVDTDAASFTVKKGQIKTNIKSVEWNEEKTVATINAFSNLSTKTYTVIIDGLELENSEIDVDVVASEPTEIEFTGEELIDDGATTTHKATVSYKVFNQYGEDITATTTLTTATSASSATASNGVATVTFGSAPTPTVTVASLTLIYGANGTSAAETFTVANTAKVSDVEVVSELTNADDKVLRTSTNLTNDKFRYEIEAYDQYGNKITDTSKLASDILVTSSLGTSFVKVSDKTYLQIDSGANLAINYPVTLVAKNSGDSVVVNVPVEAAISVESFTLGTPDELLIKGEYIYLPFAAYDQYGNEITDYTAITTDVQLSDSHSDVTATFVENPVDGTAKVKVDVGTTISDNTAVFVTSIVTAKAQTSQVSLTAQPQAVPTRIAGFDAYSVFAKNLAKNATSDLAVADIDVYDQYEREIALPSGWSIEVAASDNAFDIVTTSATQVPTTLSANSTYAGTEAVTLTLNDGTNDIANSSFEFNMSVIDKKDIVSYEIDAPEKVYAADNAPVAEQLAYQEAYEVYGLDADGNKVAIVPTDLISISSTNSNVAITAKDTVGEAVYGTDVTNASTAIEEQTTLIAVIDGAAGTVTATKTVTLSAEAPVAQDLVAKANTGIPFEDGVAVLTVAEANAMSGQGVSEHYKHVSNKAPVYFEVEDQYGVTTEKVAPAYYTISSTDSTGQNSAAGTYSINATNGIVSFSPVSGDRVTITAVMNDGVTETFTIVID